MTIELARPPVQTIDPELRRFTVDEYYQMAEVGILGEDEHVELLDGQVVAMVPIGSEHDYSNYALQDELKGAFGSDFRVLGPGPLRLSRTVQLEPDLRVVPRAIPRQRVPEPSDVLLIAEVSNTSLGYDQGTKLARYAAAGIREYWIVDVANERVLVHRDPEGVRYLTIWVANRGDTIAPLARPDATVRVDVIFS